jgi:hypothetical protein
MGVTQREAATAVRENWDRSLIAEPYHYPFGFLGTGLLVMTDAIVLEHAGDLDGPPRREAAIRVDEKRRSVERLAYGGPDLSSVHGAP